MARMIDLYVLKRDVLPQNASGMHAPGKRAA
jgi:hypothetical protein